MSDVSGSEGSERRKTPAPRLLLITGLAGTGKSTLAAAAADALDAPVLGWDWAMAALTPFDAVQRALAEGSREDYRAVGWSVLHNLAIAQLRRGRSAVLDGVATATDVQMTRRVAADEGAEVLVVVATCQDAPLHRSRIEGRERAIPGWHELTWDLVAASRQRWEPPADADLHLDAGDDLAENVDRLHRLLSDAPPGVG